MGAIGAEICTLILFDALDDPSEFAAIRRIWYINPGVNPEIVIGLVNPVHVIGADQVLSEFKY